jgi:hypothetical protein
MAQHEALSLAHQRNMYTGSYVCGKDDLKHEAKGLCMFAGGHACYNPRSVSGPWLCSGHQREVVLLEVKESTIADAGMGLFATADMEKGEALDVYHAAYSSVEPPRNKDKRTYLLHFEDYWIDGVAAQSSLVRYANTCDSPNAAIVRISDVHWAKGDKKLEAAMTFDVRGLHFNLPVAVTTRAIAKGEEIFLNYGDSYSF